MKDHNKKLFIVKDAYYQSWMVSNQEKGTSICILVADVEKEVIFDSIIFRGIQMPVNFEIKDGTGTIESNINFELSKLESKSKSSEKPNQLIYSYQGKQYSYRLESIRRENMKYY